MLKRDTSTAPIHIQKLLVALANHLHPDPMDAPGIACVLGKRQFHPEIGVYTIATQGLSGADAIVLQELIDQHGSSLPALHPRMTDPEISKFLNAFRALPNGPNWEPKIDSDEDRMRRRELRADTRRDHAALLRAEIAAGTVRIFDVNRVRQTTLQFAVDSFISREDAQAYVSAVGLSLADVMNESVPTSANAAISEPKAGSPADQSKPMQISELPSSVKSDPDEEKAEKKPKRPYHKLTKADKEVVSRLLDSGNIARAKETFKMSEASLKKVKSRYDRAMAEANSHTASHPFGRIVQ